MGLKKTLALIILIMAVRDGHTAVTGTVCPTGDECDSIGHASCDTTINTAACKCDNGYTENVDECKAVYGSTCDGSSGNTCSDLEHAVCEASKCACDSGFGVKNNVCIKTVSGTECPTGNECESIDHASCDTTINTPACKCDNGYTEDVDGCKADSGAVSMKAIIWMVYGSLLVLLLQRLL